MATPWYVAEKVVALRAEGWTHKSIAVATGLCMRTVARVLSGKAKITYEDERDVVSVYRCKGCGNLVWLRPCLICEMKR